MDDLYRIHQIQEKWQKQIKPSQLFKVKLPKQLETILPFLRIPKLSLNQVCRGRKVQSIRQSEDDTINADHKASELNLTLITQRFNRFKKSVRSHSKNEESHDETFITSKYQSLSVERQHDLSTLENTRKIGIQQIKVMNERQRDALIRNYDENRQDLFKYLRDYEIQQKQSQGLLYIYLKYRMNKNQNERNNIYPVHRLIMLIMPKKLFLHGLKENLFENKDLLLKNILKMANQHEKMQQDYLWVRDNQEADSNVKQRTFGQHYLYYHAPNKRERLEMIWRSLGKAYDWELEKFRMQKKFPDRGNKRRFFKNLFRFIKHPIGYLYWKTFKIRQPKGRIITTMLGFGLVGTLYKYKMESNQYQKKQAFLIKNGQNVEGSGLRKVGYGHDHMARQGMPLTQMFYSYLMSYDIVVSPSRDQNYRKYFELRKKYGIKD
ncbi:hypothetical protein pb186bvf_010978 [Paramecium bursaria]